MVSPDRWQAIYQEALAVIPEKIGAVRGVALAFHTVVDGLHRARPQELAHLLATHPTWQEAAARGLEHAPGELRSPADLFAAIAWSVSRSTALERVITDETTFHWLMEHFPVDQPTVGGNSGNMALALADLGLPRVLVFTPPLHPQLAQLLAQAPQILVLAPEGPVPISEAPTPAREGALHWIFEYPKGMALPLPGRTLTTTRANRFIAAWNPGNHRLGEGTQWLRAFAPYAREFSHLILSGFQLLSETYPDGSRFDTWAGPLLEGLATVRAEAPGLLIHYEWASMASPQIRTYLLQHLLPQVQSLGLNEAELGLMAHDLGHPDWPAQPGPRWMLETLHLLHQRTGLQRIQLHMPGLYLTSTTRPERALLERLALAYTALAAAARSARGRATPAALADHLATPLASTGLELLQALSELPGVTGSLDGPGLQWQGLTLVGMPTRWVDRPLWTVGLGDLISAIPFTLWTPA